MSEQGCKHNFLGTEYDPAQCTECGVTLSEWKDDRIEALEAERDDANRVMREACEANRIFKAKLDAAKDIARSAYVGEGGSISAFEYAWKVALGEAK